MFLNSAVYRFLESLEFRRFLHAGVIDTSFGDDGVASIAADVSGPVLTDVAVTPDGRIVVTGTSQSDGTLNVARFHADGALDPTFGDGGRAASRIGGSAQVRAAAVQPDHKIIVVGSRGQDYFVLRYNTNGKHDRTFGDGGLARGSFGTSVSEARDVAIRDDGSILIAGTARQANGSTAVGLARFDSDGSIDDRFGDNGTVVTKFGTLLGDAPSVFANRMALAPNGDIVLGGRFTIGNQVPKSGDDALAVMRIDSGGMPDATFSGDGLAVADFGVTDEQATGIDVDAQGRPVASIGGVGVFAALRLTAGGRRDASFGINGLGRASTVPGDTTDVLIDDVGDIVLSGTADSAPRVARLTGTGEADENFGTGGLSDSLPFASAARVVESPDQTYLVGGTDATARALARFELVKLFRADGPAGRLISAPDLRAARAGSYVFKVQWREPGGVNVATIGARDLRVTGPNGYALSLIHI